jgi:NADH/NAD ratio-sensing transcriptional regulator Rex
MGVRIAILAISGPGLREAAQELSGAGLCGILDLSGTSVAFPDSIAVARADYGSRLSALAGSLALGDRSAYTRTP